MADELGRTKAGSIGDAGTPPVGVRRLFAGGTVLCDGAMGTMLYGRGVFINRCYDELNLSQPETVRAIHAEYLQAGAEVIETNTFGANSFRLEHHGLMGKVQEINRAGVKLARECVEQIREKQACEAFLAGSIGPLGVRLEPLGKVSLDEAREAFAEQIRALVEGGPGVGADLLIVETMTSLVEAEQAILAARSEAGAGVRGADSGEAGERGVCGGVDWAAGCEVGAAGQGFAG